MANLHVRSVPEDLYEQLRGLAQSEQRSLSAQVVAMLERAVDAEGRRKDQARLLTTIRRRRFTPAANAPDSVTLLHEDRAR